MEYKIGDILYAISRFHLEDMYGREFYYNIGDQFIIMNVKIVGGEIRFSLIMDDCGANKKYVRNDIWFIKNFRIMEKKEYLVWSRAFKLKKLENT